MSGEISVERLVSARVFTIRSNPDEIVLRIESAAETHHFTMKASELSRLALQLTQDSVLVNAKPTSPL